MTNPLRTSVDDTYPNDPSDPGWTAALKAQAILEHQQAHDLLISSGGPAAAQPNSQYCQFTAKPNVGFAPGVGNMYFLPALFHVGRTYTGLGVRVTVASGVSGSLCRLGLYATLQDGAVGPLLLDAGTVNMDSTGAKFVAMSYVPQRPRLYIAVVAQGTAGSAQIPCTNNNSGFTGAGLILAENGESQGGPYQSPVTGALPATPTISGYVNHPIPSANYY